MSGKSQNNCNSITINLSHFTRENIELDYFGFPSIGISKSNANICNFEDEISFLSKLSFDFLHSDIKLYHKNWPIVFKASAEESKSLGWPLKLTIFIDDTSYDKIGELAVMISASETQVLCFNICVLNSGLISESGKNLTMLINELSGLLPIGCEVKTSLYEDNDIKKFSNNFDFITYTFSLRLSEYKYLHFSPKLSLQLKTISLLKEFNNSIHLRIKQAFVNSNNIIKANILADNNTSLADHEKQNLIFSAGWVIRYLQHFLSAGINHFTFFELCGDKGIIQQTDEESNNNGHTFAFLPLYHTLQAILEFKDGNIIPINTENSELTGILMIKGDERRLLLSNLSGSEIELIFENLPTFISLRKMDYKTLEHSIYCPLWIIGEPEFKETLNKKLIIKVSPYTIILIDLLQELF